MRFLAPTLIMLCCSCLMARAQDTTKTKTPAAQAPPPGPPAQVKGSVKDTINQTAPAHTVVMFLRPKDSVMLGYTRADLEGKFSISSIPSGDYLMWVTHPAFAPYRDSVHLNAGANDLGNIFLTLRSQILKEVIIKGVNPIRMKGDTVEYAADSFAVKPNASVEDLLKRLPGIQVDKNGTITAQGQTVQKVLVDGEEFFSDDPTVATRNLPANAVDKVQVFDKKSDQATFTGIDDGQTTKTINLKMKKGMKHGYFGKVSGGLGTDGYYENTAALNLFEDKRKIAVFGIAANTGRTGMNWSENSNYGSSNINVTQGDGGDMVAFSMNSSNDFTNIWNGTYNGEGVPTAWYGGAHYGNKWDDDKISLTSDYTYNQVNVGVNSNTLTQTKLNDSTTNLTNDNTKTNTNDRQHSLAGKYEVQFDSLTFMRITVQGKMRHKETWSDDTSFTTDQNNNMLNNYLNHTSASGDDNTFNSTLLLQRKFAKKGRTLSLNVQENYTESNTTGYQDYQLNYYSGGAFQYADTTNQYKTNYSRNLTLQSKLTYTEPLFANTYLVLDYGFNLLNGTSDLNAYNRDNYGKYSQLDSTYSNFYRANITTNLGGAYFKKSTKKYNYSFGTDVGYTDYNQVDVYQDSTQRRNYVNWYPKASYNYNFNSNTHIRFNYYGNTTQPSLSQLQPVASNSNPSNIVMGNPDLKPSYTSRFNVGYNHYDMLKDRGLWMNLSYTLTNNAFSQRDSVDPYGTNYSQTINVNNSQNFGGYINYNFKWKGPNIHLDLSPNISYSRNTTFVNGQQNNTQSGNYSVGLGFNKNKDKDYGIWFRFAPTYNTSISSIQSNTSIRYWSYNVNGSFSKTLPHHWGIEVDPDMNFYQQTSAFTNKNIALVNANITKNFMKDDALELKLAVNDLFNQNTGFNRNISTNISTQSQYTAIHRFFMFSVTWNFSKNGKPSSGWN
jgi:hypothetical protein